MGKFLNYIHSSCSNRDRRLPIKEIQNNVNLPKTAGMLALSGIRLRGRLPDGGDLAIAHLHLNTIFSRFKNIVLHVFLEILIKYHLGCHAVPLTGNALLTYN